MELSPVTTAVLPLARGPEARSEAALRKAAQDFEAAFLGEMLKTAGINSMPSAFGGGAGEEAFASLLTDEYARRMAATGGIGLAEHVYQILKSR
jgi:Rod binding domain-containing protein